MIADTKAKGATPILLSLTVRNVWKEGRVERGSGRYGEWTREVATSQRVPFVDLTKLVADRYEQMGEDAVKALFPRDHTHTSDEGAKLNAELVVTGLKGLRDQSIIRCLSGEGRTVRTAPPDQRRGRTTTRPGPRTGRQSRRLPALAQPARARRPGAPLALPHRRLDRADRPRRRRQRPVRLGRSARRVLRPGEDQRRQPRRRRHGRRHVHRPGPLGPGARHAQAG